MSKWFRWYEGTTEDGKFRMVARNASVTVATVIGVWAALLEDASHEDHRGVSVRQEGYFSAVLDIDEGTLEQILASMESAGLISVGHGAITISKWKDRQFETDKTDGTNAERQKRYREKRKRNGSVTAEKRPDTDSDTDAEVSTPKAPKGADDDMPSNVKPVSDWSVQFATPDHSGVKLEADRLVLVNGTLARWLEAFDNDKAALDLALIEARGSVQPNSRSHTLSAQVERQLARIVAKRRDQDRRYAAAAARNIKTKADQPKARTVSDVLREQIAAAKASETLQ